MTGNPEQEDSVDSARARERFGELRTWSSGVDPAELDEIWAVLSTVDADDVLGRWKGDDFATGHPINGMLTTSRWYGKTFRSRSDAHPLICCDENGELFSNLKMGDGAASLWNVEFRGEVTATMVYDGRPVFDHFKAVDANTLMGIMNGKADLVLHDGQHCYFLLERVGQAD